MSSEAAWKTAKVEDKIDNDENGACCSRNVTHPVTISSKPTIPPSTDDEVIAQLLQAEFDIEFDEELKRLEQSRNKSELLLLSIDCEIR